MKDEILDNTLEQISNFNKSNANPFEEFCRLVFKAIYTVNPPSDNPNKIGIKKENIISKQESKTIGELYLLKERMPAKHYRNSPCLLGINNPIVIVCIDGNEFIIDGSNRINYWFGKGDLKKLLQVNFHEVSRHHLIVK